MFNEFVRLLRRLALSAITTQYSISGRSVMKRLGITSFQLGELAREVERGRVPGVRVVRQGRKGRIRFVVRKDYWLKDKDNGLEEHSKEE